jgi:2-methylcitrate dehydratase PrpD
MWVKRRGVYEVSVKQHGRRVASRRNVTHTGSNIALREGNSDTRSFDAAHLENPVQAQLIQKTKVHAAEDISRRFPQSNGSRVSVRFSDGRILMEEIFSSMGHPDNPMIRGR